VRVERAPELEEHYPDRWPGEVEVKAAGRQVRRQVLNPRGDFRNPADWDDAIRKFQTIASPVIGSGEAEQVANLVRSLDPAAEMPPLWQLHAPGGEARLPINTI
jgi:2-methylcitrate dehydratase PrpD